MQQKPKYIGKVTGMATINDNLVDKEYLIVTVCIKTFVINSKTVFCLMFFYIFSNNQKACYL